MHLRFVPFPAIAVGGASLRFLADNTRAVGGSGRRRCSDVVAFSSSEKEPGPGSGEEREPRAEEALRRLVELDSQLEGLSEPRERPPAPPLPPGTSPWAFAYLVLPLMGSWQIAFPVYMCAVSISSTIHYVHQGQ